MFIKTAINLTLIALTTNAWSNYPTPITNKCWYSAPCKKQYYAYAWKYEVRKLFREQRLATDQVSNQIKDIKRDLSRKRSNLCSLRYCNRKTNSDLPKAFCGGEKCETNT